MKHSLLELSIIRYIKQDSRFHCNDLCISSDELDNNHEVVAEVDGITQSCRPDVMAYNFFGKKFHIFGEAKSSNDFNNKNENTQSRHSRQMNVMLNALKVKRNKKKYLIYACEVDIRNKIEQMLMKKKSQYMATDVNIIIIDQLHNPELF